MSEINAWTGRLAVTGVGLVTPVGLTAPSSLAAMRAGISRIGDLPWFQIPNAKGEPEPVTGSQVPIIPGNRQGPARLLRLGETALREAVAQAQLSQQHRCELFLGAAAPYSTGRVLPYAATLSQELGNVLASVAGPTTVQLFESGRAAALQAFRAAAGALTRENPPDAAIIGGVDSLISPLTLNFLQATRRLREGPKSTGILPGEGAGFLVMERAEHASVRGVPVLAFMEASAGGVDTTPLGKPNRAGVLGRVLRAVAGKVAGPDLLIISDLNGERQRAFEWMFASTRTPYYQNTLSHWLPSESIGDAGAATGSVSSVWAVAALRRGLTRAGEALVWGASDEGSREAVIFKRATGAN